MGVSLEVQQGETHAIIGPNGRRAKTTLVSQLAGNLRPPTPAAIRFAGEEITARCRTGAGAAKKGPRPPSFQITSIYPEFSRAAERLPSRWQARSGP